MEFLVDNGDNMTQTPVPREVVRPPFGPDSPSVSSLKRTRQTAPATPRPEESLLRGFPRDNKTKHIYMYKKYR